MGCAPSHQTVTAVLDDKPNDLGKLLTAERKGEALRDPKSRRSSPPVSEVLQASEQLDSVSSIQRQRTPSSRSRVRDNGSDRLRKQQQQQPPQRRRSSRRSSALRRSSSSVSAYSDEGTKSSGRQFDRRQPLGARRYRVHKEATSKPKTSGNPDRDGREVERRRSDSGRGRGNSGSDTSGERQDRAKGATRAGLRADAELKRIQAELVDARALDPSEDVPVERVPAAAEVMRGTLGADDQRQRIQHRRISRRQQQGSTANCISAVGDGAGHPQQDPSSGDVSPVRSSNAVAIVRNSHQTEQKRDRIRAWVAVADSEMHSVVRTVQACWRVKLARKELQLMRSCAGSSVGTGA